MKDAQELARALLEEIETAADDDRYRGLRDEIYGLGIDIIPLLREELSHTHFRRRMAAVTNLGRLADVESVSILTGLLSDPHASVREMCLFSLGILGDSSAVESILVSLNDFDADVRYRAIVALGDLGYEKYEGVLIRAMSDDSIGVREQALSQLRSCGTTRSVTVVLKALLEREADMQRVAEESLDRVIQKMTREDYKSLQESLSLRERRLILNYLESRNLQEVYPTLWQRLQVVSRHTPAQRGLDKYGRLLNTPEEREMLSRAYGRDEVIDQLIEHFEDENARRSILLVGEAGVGKTAIIQEFAQRLSDRDETWQILETNTSELISGTRYLGDWETKLKEMVEAILKYDKVVLYLTNPNDLLGAGAHSKSDENFADFFKPFLQRGQVTMIAECTEESIRGGLSRDPGFLRLFRQVRVPEMTSDETFEVLSLRLKDTTVRELPVVSQPDCLREIVDFAQSFFTRSVAPGRAFDFLDALIDYGSRKMGKGSKQMILERSMIPSCLAEVTGISLDLLDDEVPLSLEETKRWFSERLVEQEHALTTMVDRLALIKAGLCDPDKPKGVFFLVGPTGVGKTFFTKLVAERLFGDRSRMVRFDLSEYRGRYAIERLIGSPHDKDREGLLTEAIRNQPYSVVLFDEFEKADPEVFNLFLQILDEGRLTDARGKTTDFRQTIIFLTSNLGSSGWSVASLGFGADERSGSEDRIKARMDEFFAPEFLNRLTDILVFSPLSSGAMGRLIELELQEAFQRRGFQRHRISFEIDEEAKRWLEEHGFSLKFGARALKRTIEKSVLVPLSRFLVARDVFSKTASFRLVRVNDRLEVEEVVEGLRPSDDPDRSVHPSR
jgi:ATP-dependent Clp protease ATP-binding subunit ClpC